MPLFSKKKKAPDPNEAHAKLRESHALLTKREESLTRQIDEETAKAKAFMAKKNKRQAMQCLKRRQLLETQSAKIGNIRMSLDVQLLGIEQASVNIEAMGAMKLGADAMRGIQSEVTLGDVDDTMDDLAEQLDIAGEISDALAQSLGGTDLMDDDDLLAELGELEKEGVDEQLLDLVASSASFEEDASAGAAAGASASAKAYADEPVAQSISPRTKATQSRHTRDLDDFEALAG